MDRVRLPRGVAVDDLQIDRIFNAIADMDRRFSTKLDAISENQASLRADVSGLSTWRGCGSNVISVGVASIKKARSTTCLTIA